MSVLPNFVLAGKIKKITETQVHMYNYSRKSTHETWTHVWFQPMKVEKTATQISLTFVCVASLNSVEFNSFS